MEETIRMQILHIMPAYFTTLTNSKNCKGQRTAQPCGVSMYVVNCVNDRVSEYIDIEGGSGDSFLFNVA